MDSPLRFTNSEITLLARRADILMTMEAEDLQDLNEIEGKLQNLYGRERYHPFESDSEGEVEYDEDEEGPLEQWLYDPVNSDESGEPQTVIHENGNGEWENELRRITQHDIKKGETTQNEACCNKVKDNTLPDKRLCIPGRCECPMIPAMLPDEEKTVGRRFDTINELAMEGATYEEKTDDNIADVEVDISIEEAENLMIEADDKEDDIENEIINVFAEDHDRSVETQHHEVRAAMLQLSGRFEEGVEKLSNLLKRKLFGKFCLSRGFNKCDRCLKFQKKLYFQHTTEEDLCTDCILGEETDSDNDTSDEDTTERNASPPKKRNASPPKKYEKEKYAIKFVGIGHRYFNRDDLLQELPPSPELPTLIRKCYHDKSNLHLRIPGDTHFEHRVVMVGSGRLHAMERLLFTLTEARRICNLRNGVVQADKVESKSVTRRNAKKAKATAVESLEKWRDDHQNWVHSNANKKRKWKRRVAPANYEVSDSSYRFSTSSSSNSSCTYTYPTDLQHIIKGVSEWHCPIDDCEKNIKSMALNGKKHDFQKGKSLHRHLVDRHNCQLMDVHGNPIPKYKYKCYHPECLKKPRYVGSTMFVGIKPFHDITQYKRHLETHHRHIEKTGKVLHVKGYRDHIITENYLECTDGCKWWEKPKDCSCWQVPDDCDCKECGERKYKRRKM